jgi:NHLM bacteriocin system ABC transporter ATP-binding protein
MSHNRIFLNNPEQILVVYSGTVALFAVPVKSDGSLGKRRYLATFEKGEALFGISPDYQEKLVLIAVQIGETDLLTIDRSEWEDLLAVNHDKAVNFLQTWLTKLGTIFPTLNREIPPLNTEVIKDWETLQQYLSQLHEDFINALKVRSQQEQKELLLKSQERQQLNIEYTSKAIANLGSLLPQDHQSLNQNKLLTNPEYQALYLAASAVAKHLKITIYPPANTEDITRIKEPLEAIARASQIRIRRIILTDKWWLKDCGAILAYTRDENRPVALLPTTKNRYQLFDPVSQNRTIINSQIAADLQPTAYTFYPPFPSKKLTAIELIQFALKEHISDLFLLLWTGIFTTFLGMLTPQVTAILIDYAIPTANKNVIFQLCLGLLSATMGQLIFAIAETFSRLRIETISDIHTQAAAWDRLLNLPLPFFREYSTGDLRSRVSAISEIRSQIGGNTLDTFFSILVSFPNIWLLFYYNFNLGILAILILIFNITFTVIIGVITRKKATELQELNGNIFGLMVQLINGVGKLRVAGAENRAFAHWSKYYTQQQKLKLTLQSLSDTLSLFNQMLPTISIILLFNTAINLINNTQNLGLSTGTFLAFNATFGILLAATTNLADVVIRILYVAGLWERVKPILNTEPEVNNKKIEPSKLTGKLGLENVNFSYGKNTNLILKNVTITAKPGEFIAIVGSSGSGKSTIMRLLLGFETPTTGKVYYDHYDLREINIQSLRRQLGVVLQSSRINSGSIFDNIAGGALISIDEAWKACKQVNLADDIAAMPMEMHTVISEGGGNISGGQKQRLLIARALVLKPKILLFDEATSSLDNKTQAIVTESLEKLNVTRVVIAHRLSTIQKADNIYVLEAGKIVQQGRFEQLIKEQGAFSKLMKSQII